jgi:glycosyltransferase involved in cell wall biosynthesis
MKRRTDIVINGRFLIQRVTGVQRFALETLSAMDCLLDQGAYAALRGRLKIVAPKGLLTPLALRHIGLRQGGRMTGYGWEQVELPFLARGAAIVSLCALGPVLYRRQLAVIHDTTFLAVPHTFSRLTRTLYRLLVPALIRRSARVAAVSDFTRGELALRLGIDPRRVAVCSEGGNHILAAPADYSVLDRLALRDGRFFLAVGVGGPNKNLSGLLAAFAAARAPDMTLVISGQRNPRIHPEGVVGGDGVTYAGYVSDAQLRALYENALALVYPSLYEGFGLPPLEAMACGCPVISSNQGAIVEIAGGAAVHVPMFDIDALAMQIGLLAGNAEMRRDLSQRGRARAAEFSWDRTASRLLDIAAEL